MIAFADPTPLAKFVRRVNELNSVDPELRAINPQSAAVFDIAQAVVRTAETGLDGNQVDVLVDRVAGGPWRMGTLPPFTGEGGETLEHAVSQAAFMCASAICMAAMSAGEDLVEVARNLRWVG